MADVTEQILHDWLLANKPEATDHDSVTCAYCSEKASTQEETVSSTGTNMISQEQHEALLASAVEKASAAAALQATTETDAELLRLNEKLEEAVKALQEKDTMVEALQAQITDRDDVDRLEALATEREKLVQAAAHFSEEQIQARRSVWAKMEQGDFDAYLEDIRQVAAVSSGKSKTPESSLDTTRETAGDLGTEMDAVKALFGSLATI